MKINIASYADHRTDDLKARYEAIELARLPQIEVRPVRPPTYNCSSMDYARWLENNLQTLTDYWNALVTTDGIGPLGEEDLFIFCMIQHESEQDRMEELKRCYGSKGDQP